MYANIFICEGAEDLTEVKARELAQETRKEGGIMTLPVEVKCLKS